MADIRTINESVSVAPQITVDDIVAIKAAGFVAIVNNRPDEEEAGQPAGDAIRAAAEAAGLAYVAIPITHAGFSHPQIDAMTQALPAADGPVLAYCRSGTRCTMLWALSQHGVMDDQEITLRAAKAGYDVSGLLSRLRTR